jgi:hypothetical protein
MFDGLDPRRRFIVYLGINIVVSALTTLLFLVIWSRFNLAGAPDFLENSSGQGGSEFADQLQITTVIAAGDLDNESVLIEHVGDHDVSLSGWELKDEDGNDFQFPALVLHPGARVAVFTHQGDNNSSELYWDRQVAVWSSGEEVRLLDPSNDVQASFLVP